MSEVTTDSVDDPAVVRLGDVEFRVRRRVSLPALIRFAHAAKAKGSTELDQWDAIYKLCQAALHPDEDFDRFLDVADSVDADDDDLLTFVRKVMAGQTERPTGRPSDSSDGPVSTERKSESAPEPPEESVHSRVIRMHEKAGRPDKALLVLMAQEQQAASAV